MLKTFLLGSFFVVVEPTVCGLPYETCQRKSGQVCVLVMTVSCQIGTVVDNAADFYTDRVPNKARKSTMVDELLADAEFKKFQKRK